MPRIQITLTAEEHEALEQEAKKQKFRSLAQLAAHYVRAMLQADGHQLATPPTRWGGSRKR